MNFYRQYNDLLNKLIEQLYLLREKEIMTEREKELEKQLLVSIDEIKMIILRELEDVDKLKIYLKSGKKTVIIMLLRKQ